MTLRHRLLQPTRARAVHVTLAVIATVAVIGFFAGLAGDARPAEPYAPVAARPLDPRHAPPAPTYDELRALDLGPNAVWPPPLDALREVGPEPVRGDDPVATAAALAARTERRAYDGAPPVVPHPVDQLDAASCLACHGDGLRVEAGRTAPRMSHAHLAACTQCHVPTAVPGLPPREPADNAFVGAAPAARGPRAWPGAPPQIPHRLHMREDCRSCHGVDGPAGLRTDHPDRLSCAQCHVPALDAGRRQAPERGDAP